MYPESYCRKPQKGCSPRLPILSLIRWHKVINAFTAYIRRCILVLVLPVCTCILWFSIVLQFCTIFFTTVTKLLRSNCKFTIYWFCTFVSSVRNLCHNCPFECSIHHWWPSDTCTFHRITLCCIVTVLAQCNVYTTDDQCSSFAPINCMPRWLLHIKEYMLQLTSLRSLVD